MSRTLLDFCHKEQIDILTQTEQDMPLSKMVFLGQIGIFKFSVDSVGH